MFLLSGSCYLILEGCWTRGYCLSPDGKTRPQGLVYVRKNKMNECADYCSSTEDGERQDVTGCEYNKEEKSCAAHTQPISEIASGHSTFQCYVFKKRNEKAKKLSGLYILLSLALTLIVLQLG